MNEEQSINHSNFLFDLSTALAITPAAISQALRSNPSLQAHAVTYQRLPQEERPGAAEAE